MKNCPISKLNKLAMTVSAMMIILLSSCRQEDSYSLSPGPALVKLSVSASNNGATATNNDPASAIKSLCILQFNTTNGDKFGTLRHVGKGTESSTGSGQYTATLMQSVNDNDKYKLVILANLPQYNFLHSLSGKSYEQVQQACLSAELTGENSTPAFDTNTPFPMFGIVNNGAPILINATNPLGNVSLVRAIARVDIGVGTKNPDNNTWTKGNVKFEMTQIQIWKAGKQYAYMPAENNFSSSGGILTIAKPSSAGTTETKMYDDTYITNTTYCSEKIYLPEADLQWGNVYDTNHTNRLAIIVGGKYNRSQTETFYRVDFIDDSNQNKMNILRNHVYQFTINSVTDPGYATAELAYNSVPKNIGFNATLTQWTAPDAVNIPSIVGYYISYNKFNSDYLTWDTNPKLDIPKKKDTWDTNRYWRFNYNSFYDEANSFYSPRIMEGQNGILYNTVKDAFALEGAFPALMVSGDDVFDLEGNETIAWKTGSTLTAFDLCRDYSGEGYSDWRLPRLSELALIYLNQEALKKTRGFIPMTGTYWCGSEYLVSNSDEDRKHSEQAWSINFDSTNPGNATAQQKSTKLKIRCVRQTQEMK